MGVLLFRGFFKKKQNEPCAALMGGTKLTGGCHIRFSAEDKRLGHLDSNQDPQIQSLVCCHCTMPQNTQYPSARIEIVSQSAKL